MSRSDFDPVDVPTKPRTMPSEEYDKLVDEHYGTSKPMTEGIPALKEFNAMKKACLTAAEMQEHGLLLADSAARKKIPLATGCLDYFPDALAAVAELSYIGNEKHNPGEPLHWARGKSNDHPDCLMRHFLDRGKMDGEVRHSTEVCWRALAILQLELEAAREASPR